MLLSEHDPKRLTNTQHGISLAVTNRRPTPCSTDAGGPTRAGRIARQGAPRSAPVRKPVVLHVAKSQRRPQAHTSGTAGAPAGCGARVIERHTARPCPQTSLLHHGARAPPSGAGMSVAGTRPRPPECSSACSPPRRASPSLPQASSAAPRSAQRVAPRGARGWAVR